MCESEIVYAFSNEVESLGHCGQLSMRSRQQSSEPEANAIFMILWMVRLSNRRLKLIPMRGDVMNSEGASSKGLLDVNLPLSLPLWKNILLA